MNCVAYSIYSQTLLTTTGSGVPIRKTEKTRPKRRVRIPSRTHLNGFSHPISRTPADRINCIIISPPGQQVSVPGPMGLGQKNTPNRGGGLLHWNICNIICHRIRSQKRRRPETGNFAPICGIVPTYRFTVYITR